MLQVPFGLVREGFLKELIFELTSKGEKILKVSS